MNEIAKKNGITYGVIIGVMGILTATITYALQMYTSWWLGTLGFAISIALYCILLSKTKKQMGGVFTFKDAFSTFFVAALIAVIIGTIYNIALYNFIDPGAKEVVREQTIKTTVKMMESMGTPSSAINEAVEKMEKEDQFSIPKQLFGAVIALCVSCVLGLILALIFKSRTTYKE